MSEPLLIAKSKHDLVSAARAGQPPRPDHRRDRHRQDGDAADAWPRRFSAIGVPVFMADVKGDLAGLRQPGELTPKLKERLDSLELADAAVRRPARSRSGTCSASRAIPVRATVSDMGPLLLSRMLNLNDTQEGVLTLVFKIADDNGLLLLDLKDLRAMLQHVGDNAQAVHHRVRQRLRRQRSARSSAACSRSSSRAATSSSASRRSTSPT